MSDELVSLSCHTERSRSGSRRQIIRRDMQKCISLFYCHAELDSASLL